MQINFNKPLTGLNGQNAIDENGKETTIGKILGSTLASSNKGNPMKLMGWAKKMWDGEVINLDKSDRKMLTDFVENAEELTNLTKNAIIDLLDNPGEE